MRTVIQAFPTGHCGRHYLIADVGKIGVKDAGVHIKRVQHLYSLFEIKGLGPCGGMLLCRGEWQTLGSSQGRT